MKNRSICHHVSHSWRNPTDGSWFMQALTEGIRNADFKNEDFMRILTKAAATVAYDRESNTAEDHMHSKKQVPCIVSTLTKCLFFE